MRTRGAMFSFYFNFQDCYFDVLGAPGPCSLYWFLFPAERQTLNSDRSNRGTKEKHKRDKEIEKRKERIRISTV
ncbi:hypothetical protein RRG08_027993 [Elysia crispata]|uniref:Uncharacterized protein n=1 Tax=Elysia crispata TaxID=231223 RepID=A0AAE1ED20_9GAST|nr:hypothetical protein RRG08_027993 [Elysia crispata]